MMIARSQFLLLAVANLALMAVPAVVLAGSTLPEITTVTTGGPCIAAMQTRNNTVALPGGDILGNAPVVSVTMTKPCTGAVTAEFNAVVYANQSTQQVFVLGVAKCVGTGGYATPHCTVGQVIQGSPGPVIFKDMGVVTSGESHSADFVWTGLKRGKWRFDIRPTGFNDPSLEYRSLIVNAYKGG
jgi:hypothetical protein